MTNQGESVQTRGGRQMAIVVGAGILGVALSVALVWRVMAAPGQQERGKRSADETRLLERAAQEKARAAAQASKLRQQEIGQGLRFDAEGNLIEGAPEGSSDLPQNRALDEAAGGPPPRDEIAQGVRRPPRSATTRQEAYDYPAEDPEEPEGDRTMPPEDAEIADRADPKGPMLGYSTLRSASWAVRRPEVAEDSKGDNPTKNRSGGQDDEGLGRVVTAMEDFVTMGAPGREDMPMVAPVGGAGGFSTSNSPQVTPGPGARGSALYAETGEAPAERGPQMFAAGGVGDMRIGGNVGPDHVVRQGKFLDCVLVTRLQADLVDSPVVAMVSRDFVTLDGRYVLVPAGSKLLGAAGAVGNLQQARVYIKFDRVIFPDQRAAYFPVRKVPAVDGRGAAGVPGSVDRHLMLQFGAAVMLGMFDGLAAAVQGSGSAAGPTLRELVAARTSSNLSNVVAGVIQRYANVVPTVTVEPGTKMKVFFAEDVRMSPYLTTSELSWIRRDR